MISVGKTISVGNATEDVDVIVYPSNILLNEFGEPILDESGNYISLEI
jgi:hypothetical protein